MPLTIGSNALSLRAQRAFSAATEGVSAATRRIGSGLRINSSADDAAGLAVAEGLNISTRVFSQGAKNINDALSMINIANGSLQQLSGIVTRQTELAEQAANGVYSATQRKALNQEAAALTNEYNRIIATTKFNGISLYPPSGTSDIRIQMGFGLSASVALSFGEKLSRDIGNGTFASPILVAVPPCPTI